MQFTSICVVLDLQEEQKSKVKGTEAWTSVKSESAIADINALFKKVATATARRILLRMLPIET